MGKSFLYPYYESIPGDGVTHGMKWMSMGTIEWLRWFPYTLYIMLCLVSSDDGESE